jgi:hypothetical protein
MSLHLCQGASLCQEMNICNSSKYGLGRKKPSELYGSVHTSFRTCTRVVVCIVAYVRGLQEGQSCMYVSCNGKSCVYMQVAEGTIVYIRTRFLGRSRSIQGDVNSSTSDVNRSYR